MTERAPTLRAYSSKDYYRRLVTNINNTKPGDRVILASLWIMPGERSVAKILDAMNNAAARGVDVTLIVDGFTFLVKSGIVLGPAYWFGPNHPIIGKAFKDRQAALDRLEQSGGKYFVCNKNSLPLLSPYRGRSHIKFTVINDEVYIGGCNLAEENHDDVMAGFTDAGAADWLATLSRQIIATGSVSSAQKNLDTTYDLGSAKLLLDAGRSGQSLIMDIANKLVRDATKAVYATFQYYPHGNIADKLAAADARGLAVTILQNHPFVHQWPLNIVDRLMSKGARVGRPKSFKANRLKRPHRYMHAKIIATDSGWIIGSHNYMPNGVKAGTAEIALVGNDPRFGQELIKCLEKQVYTGANHAPDRK